MKLSLGDGGWRMEDGLFCPWIYVHGVVYFGGVEGG